MSDGSSHSSHARSLFGLFLPLAALFVIAVSIGTGKVLVFWAGVALAVGALWYHGMNSLAPRRRLIPIEGSARVISASLPPAGVPMGRCELRLVVEAPGLPATAQTVWDQSVLVTKWPIVGQRLPVYVLRTQPRQVIVRWDKVRTSAAEADAEFATLLASRSHESIGTPTSDDDELGSYLEELFHPEDRVEPAAASESLPAAVSIVPGQAASPQVPPLPAFELPELTPLDLPEFELATFAPLPKPPSPVSELPGQLAERVNVESEPGKVPLPRRGLTPLGPTPFQGVGASLMVSDLLQSLTFYRDTLGFTEVDSGGDAAILAVGEAKLLLHQLADAPKEGLRLSHVNLEVSDVDAVYEELRAKGVLFIQHPRAVANTELIELRSVAFRDPDGHRLALTSWRYR